MSENDTCSSCIAADHVRLTCVNCDNAKQEYFITVMHISKTVSHLEDNLLEWLKMRKYYPNVEKLDIYKNETILSRETELSTHYDKNGVVLVYETINASQTEANSNKRKIVTDSEDEPKIGYKMSRKNIATKDYILINQDLPNEPTGSDSTHHVTGHSTNGHSNELSNGHSVHRRQSEIRLAHPVPSTDDEYFRFLVYSYGEHQRRMQLSFMTEEQFLEVEGPTLRAMTPSDVSALAKAELAGLFYWIEKQKPYKYLPKTEKAALLRRYSVRKLSLDHFYNSSKHRDHVVRREFVMNNNTFVPSDRTGFELVDDDNIQIEAKRVAFARTFDRFWGNVIEPFMEKQINDAEVTFLHIMMLWSPQNDEHVTERTQEIMRQQRDWAVNRLNFWYKEHNLVNRLDVITDLLEEIESVIDMHCQDFQVAKMFDFCDMSQFWYETLCYAPCNTNFRNLDQDRLAKLSKYAKVGNLEAHLVANEGQGTATNQPAGQAISPDLGSIDPAHLVFNAQMLPNVMAPLPDDNYATNKFFQKK